MCIKFEVRIIKEELVLVVEHMILAGARRRLIFQPYTDANAGESRLV